MPSYFSVAAFTSGRNTPAARFRVRQYVPVLARQNIKLREFYPHFGAYPPERRWLRPAWALGSLAERLPHLLAGRSYQVSLIQREMISTFATFEGIVKRPRLFDVDDAIHLYGRAPRRIAGHVDLVICGNRWLAEVYEPWASRVAVLPTAVDTDCYRPSPDRADRRQRIGWIGSAGNLCYLQDIESALRDVMAMVPDAEIEICCDRRPTLPKLPMERVYFRPWTPTAEIEHFAAVSIGLMPLRDGDWERGKCSFKMLQYMAHGIPCVVSPVGMNREVLSQGEAGLSAITSDDWVDALVSLLRNRTECCRLGSQGRSLVENRYSVRYLGEKLGALLRSFI